MFHPNRLPSDVAASCEAGSESQSIAAVFCFSIDVVADPGTMPRVLEQFAKRGLVPSRWHSDVIEPEAMQIDVQIVGLSATLGEDIARCLRAVVGVHGVLTTSKAEQGPSPPRPDDVTPWLRLPERQPRVLAPNRGNLLAF